MQPAEPKGLTYQEKSAYISGVIDAVALPPECREVCKQLLVDLVTEIDRLRKEDQSGG